MLPSNSRECGTCLCVLPFFLLGIAGIVAGTLFYMLHGGYTIGLTIYAISFVLIIIGWQRWSQELTKTKIIGIARGHSSITMEELSRLTGKPVDKVRDIVYNAISSGNLSGTIEGMTFVRETAAPGTKTVEREVMVTRKVPETCFKCGASINPQEVEWTGPDTVRCSHCGATLSVRTERL